MSSLPPWPQKSSLLHHHGGSSNPFKCTLTGWEWSRLPVGVSSMCGAKMQGGNISIMKSTQSLSVLALWLQRHWAEHKGWTSSSLSNTGANWGVWTTMKEEGIRHVRLYTQTIYVCGINSWRIKSFSWGCWQLGKHRTSPAFPFHTARMTVMTQSSLAKMM